MLAPLTPFLEEVLEDFLAHDVPFDPELHQLLRIDCATIPEFREQLEERAPIYKVYKEATLRLEALKRQAAQPHSAPGQDEPGDTSPEGACGVASPPCRVSTALRVPDE